MKPLLVCYVFQTILFKSLLFLSSLRGSCLLLIVQFLILLVFSLFLLIKELLDLRGFLKFLFLLLFELSSFLEGLLVGHLLGHVHLLLGLLGLLLGLLGLLRVFGIGFLLRIFKSLLGFLFFLLLVNDSVVLGGQDLSCLLDFLVLLEMFLSLIPLLFGLHLLMFQLLNLTLNLLHSILLCLLLDLLGLLLKLLLSKSVDFFHLFGRFLLDFFFYLGGLFLPDLSFCLFLNLLS